MERRDTAPRRRTPRYSVDRRFLLVTLAVTAVILHGSLYPYDFRPQPGSDGPIATLLESWHAPRDSFGEMAANVLLYMPFGFFAVLALRIPLRLPIVILLGLALCTSIELTQYYDTSRITSLMDVCLNTTGTVLGAIAGVIVRIPSLAPVFRLRSLRPVPLLLLIAMLGYHLYPYVPTIDLHKYWGALKPLWLHPYLGSHAVFHYFALWLTVSFLVSDAVGRPRWSWFFVLSLAAFVFAAKVLIVDQSVSLAEVAGGLPAIILWLAVLERTRWGAAIVAIVLCALVIMLRLEPFVFRAIPGQFGWLPFRSFLGGAIGVNVQSFFEKSFLYGGLVWVAGRAGLDLRVATVAVAAIVLATSVAEIYLPGRSAEITDAIVTIMMGAIFIAITGTKVRRAPATARP